MSAALIPTTMYRTPCRSSSERNVRSATVRMESTMPQSKPQALARAPQEILERAVDAFLVPLQLCGEDPSPSPKSVVALEPFAMGRAHGLVGGGVGHDAATRACGPAFEP